MNSDQILVKLDGIRDVYDYVLASTDTFDDVDTPETGSSVGTELAYLLGAMSQEHEATTALVPDSSLLQLCFEKLGDRPLHAVWNSLVATWSRKRLTRLGLADPKWKFAYLTLYWPNPGSPMLQTRFIAVDDESLLMRVFGLASEAAVASIPCPVGERPHGYPKLPMDEINEWLDNLGSCRGSAYFCVNGADPMKDCQAVMLFDEGVALMTWDGVRWWYGGDAYTLAASPDGIDIPLVRNPRTKRFPVPKE